MTLNNEFNVIISRGLTPTYRIREMETFGESLFARDCIELLDSVLMLADESWTLSHYHEMLDRADKEITQF